MPLRAFALPMRVHAHAAWWRVSKQASRQRRVLCWFAPTCRPTRTEVKIPRKLCGLYRSAKPFMAWNLKTAIRPKAMQITAHAWHVQCSSLLYGLQQLFKTVMYNHSVRQCQDDVRRWSPAERGQRDGGFVRQQSFRHEDDKSERHKDRMPVEDSIRVCHGHPCEVALYPVPDDDHKCHRAAASEYCQPPRSCRL
jgi:hypothetical protein